MNELTQPGRSPRATRPLAAGTLLRRGLALLGLGCCSIALALSPAVQPEVARRPPPPVKPVLPPPMPPILRLVVPNAATPIRLDEVRVRAEINGNLAQTSIELSFYNPNNRQLEGELQFPLAPGQTVNGFAMDMNGALREAVPVEKTRGQAIFEDVTRQRVDPALLQVTEGNNFKLRVYPLLPQQKKTVVLRIGETLSGTNLQYRLPLVYSGRVGRLDFEAVIRGSANAPRNTGLLQAATVDRSVEGYRVRLAQADARLESAAEIGLAAAAQPATLTERFDGETYFYAQPRIAGAQQPRALPKQVALLWDSSGSGAERDHVREFALLDAYFKRAGNMRVSLVRFRESAEAVEDFEVARGDWTKLRGALEKIPYDGATRLPEPGVMGAADEALLFTDGLQNFGAAVGNWPKPLYAVSAAHKRNAVLLQHVAEASGGRLIDLMQGTAESAGAQLLMRGPRVVAVGGEGASELVLASRLPVDGRVLLAGKVAEGGGNVRLRIAGADGRDSEVLVRLTPEGSTSTLAAHAWAQMRVNELDAEYSLNRAAIKRIGQRFKLVTRETSLIILDTAADYARYEVEPPSELRDEVERMRGLAVRQRGSERGSHLEQVVKQFEQKQAWWNKDFPKGVMPVPEEKAKKAASSAALRDEPMPRVARPAAPSVAAPPPPPASAPIMPAPAASMDLAAGQRSDRYSESAANQSARTRAAPGGSADNAPTIGIQLQTVAIDAPYARRLREADAATRYRIYMDERASYTNSTAFFLDAADIFIDKGDKALGLRILGNLAEMDLENRHILRILGYRLLQAGEPALAVPVFEKVLELSPEEPQSYRDLGLAYAAVGQTQKAVDRLYEVVTKPWHNRFPGVELIALAEMNAVIATAPTKPDVSAIDARLLKNLPLDLRTVLTWDADNTDIDLWVTDPNGEKAYYGHQLTYQGGRMSQDFTGGYGPEEFSLKGAKPGKYRIEAQFYGHRQQVVAGATTLQVKLQSGFGKPGGSERMITLRLTGQNDMVFVGEFEVPAP